MFNLQITVLSQQGRTNNPGMVTEIYFIMNCGAFTSIMYLHLLNSHIYAIDGNKIIAFQRYYLR